MPNKQNIQQQFTELEYVFQKYFNEHLAPVISQEQRHLREQQEAETRQRFDDGWGGFVDAASPFTTHMVRRQAGPWNQKNSDALVKVIDQRLGKDKAITHDIGMMVTAWRSLAVAYLGEEKYKELSKQSPSGDLATDFVNNRFEGMMMQQLAKSKIPHSGLEYMLRKGIGGSLLAGLADTNIGPKSDRDKDLEELALRLYKPKAGTKVSGALLTAILDGATLGPGGIKTFAVTVAGDTALQCLNIEGKTFDQTVSEAMFDDEDAITAQRQKTKKVNPAHSEVVDMLNQSFDKKMKVPEYHPAYSPSRVNQLSTQVRGATADGLQHLSNIESLYKEFALTYKKGGSYPSWMDGKSQEECIRLSSQFFAIATEMKSSGKKSMKVNGQMMTLEEVSQRGYDYGRAAAAKQQAANAAKQAEAQKQQAPQQSFAAASVHQPQQQSQQYAARQQQNVAVSQGTVQQQNTRQQQTTASVNSWSDLMNQLGLSGFGDVGHNLGYVLSMLPDMLIGMFTGKTESLKLKDNMFPLAAIFAGMFVKNPILKMMLIGLGGANLLNKAGHEAMERDGVIQKPTRYREYPNELLDPRIENPAMKGYSLVATIDGVPSSITIDERTADAYYKGKIPLNTLCNAVLRKYDEQYETFNQNYVQRLDDAEDHTLSRGLK